MAIKVGMVSNILKIQRLILFIIILCIGLVGLNHICTDKELQKNLYYIRYEQKDSIDVFFFGNSHASQGYLPMELWNKYGYTAYSMSIPEMPLPLVYYCALDAVKMQHPELLVVDLSAALFYYNDFSYMHRLVDNFTLTTRMKTIKEFVPANKRLEYFYPLYLYHSSSDTDIMVNGALYK